jgi:hypothetical protein
MRLEAGTPDNNTAKVVFTFDPGPVWLKLLVRLGSMFTVVAKASSTLYSRMHWNVDTRKNGIGTIKNVLNLQCQF